MFTRTYIRICIYVYIYISVRLDFRVYDVYLNVTFVHLERGGVGCDQRFAIHGRHGYKKNGAAQA